MTDDRASRPRRRVAIGPSRPQYFLDAENDRMFMMLAALTAEVWTVRERVDTMETLAGQGILPTAEAMEKIAPSPERQARLDSERMAMLRRVYRVVMEELDEIREAGGQARPAFEFPEEAA